MNAETPTSDPTLPPFEQAKIKEVCDSFKAVWKAGQRPSIEKHLKGWEEPGRSSLLRGLLILDVHYRQRSGETPSREDYRARFPDDAPLVNEVFSGGSELPQGASTPCQDNDKTVDYGAHDQSHDDDPIPDRVGRYEVRRLLGKGGFGIVYLAHDETLLRDVAIKVPRRDRITEPEDVEAYLTEARVVAGLKHPHIVPVHDVGQLVDGRCYVVSEYIEGTNLSTKMRRAPLSHKESARLVATVAEALHYAHSKELVHRDIKPANILLDVTGKPYVADFGLALREDDYGRDIGTAGTPSYMSPEQARGEGHLVDGRSDVFSLGVVFYELLTERRPFRGHDSREVLQMIRLADVRPPRQLKDSIPKELERICLKALSNRAANRYVTALDMAEDLRHFLAGPQVVQPSAEPRKPTAEVHVGDRGGETERPFPTIVPKGLRSFDAEDADFFLALLPGPRDRDGLPESIRFWKSRIERTDPDKTFRVGLIYGPSGCGKSSLIKAGLLPRLDQVLSLHIESTAENTETRVLRELRKCCPRVPHDLNLVDTVALLRREPTASAGKKVCVVLDQFEQWLNARVIEQNAELVAALRQCDGGRIQCVVSVRDDFVMGATRFLHEMDIRLIDGHNVAVIDLFNPIHARKVLTEFGRSYGRLRENLADLTKEHEVFLATAIRGLTQDGLIVPIRLALFSEMLKNKDWLPETLKKIGGIAGVGETFLEETFSAPSASPEHRLHQRAARAVLKALLPELGTNIKGHIRSRDELREVSGYGDRPRGFNHLISILDIETRLITPADPKAIDADDESARRVQSGHKYYQLTHDYLVVPLRDWLYRKQKETLRGRVELRLEERAAAWNAKPENRHLPAWWEYVVIRCLTRKRNWTESQKQTMKKAATYHGVKWSLAFGVVLLVVGVQSWLLRTRRDYLATLARSATYNLLKTGDTREAEYMLGNAPDPTKRTVFIKHFAQNRGRFPIDAHLLEKIGTPEARSGLCLAIGTVQPSSLEDPSRLQSELAQLYLSAPDTGTHSAAGWALRQWQVELPPITSSTKAANGQNWYVNTVGMTMLRIPAGTSVLGEYLPDYSPSLAKTVTLTRDFFLSDREVSVEQFQQFMDDRDYSEKPKDWKGPYKQRSPAGEHPVQEVSWYDAVLFCNWLSREEALKVCYKPETWECDFEADGYRLPTEAEWEHACRAGAVTDYSWGNDKSFLTDYAVWGASGSEPCGHKLPNAWGLFDMHGNVWEWCHDRPSPPHWIREIEPRHRMRWTIRSRVIRGGSWGDPAENCRSAGRSGIDPQGRSDRLGFRVATVTPGK